MNTSLLLSSSEIFEEANTIDCVRQTFIDLDDEQDIEEVQNFLDNSKIYLDKNLSINTLNELIAAILSCFKHYSNELLKYLEEYIKNVKINANYVILTSTILSYLTNNQNQLNFPDYHQFVSEALHEILAQINNDQQLIVFDHEILINYKNELIIDLLLSTNLKEKLVFDFFPFLFSKCCFLEKNAKFELLQKKLFISILPQTDNSYNELFEFITSKNINLISSMSREAFSMVMNVYNYILLSKSGDKFEIEGLSKETILPFFAILSIFLQKFSEKFCFSQNLLDLNQTLIDGVNYSKSKNLSIITASIDEILSNCFDLLQSKIISIDSLYQILRILCTQLKNGNYFSEKTIIFNSIFKLSDQKITDEVSEFFEEIGFDILNLCVKYFSELNNKENKIRYKLNLNQIKQSIIFDFINNSNEITKAIDFLVNFCKNQPQMTKSDEISQRLLETAQKKIEEHNDKDILLIGNFLRQNSFNDEFEQFCQLPLPEYVKPNFISIEKSKSIDDILYYLLNVDEIETQDETIKLFIDKMLENEEILDIYIALRIYKYTDKEFNIKVFLIVCKDEYEKCEDKFINIVNKAYVMNAEKKYLIRNNNFSIYSLKIPDFGSSIITKLFDSIKENPNNYQAFFCLKNIASSLPLLFYNRHDEVFNIVLPSLNNFSLLFDSEFLNDDDLKSAKAAYSAYSFLIPIFHLPVMYDKFLIWINENILSFSDSQAAAFISILNYFFYEFLFEYSFVVYEFKLKIIEKLCKLFDKIETFENSSFYNWYINTFNSIILNIYKVIKDLNEKELIQMEELNKIENPHDYLFSHIFIKYAWIYLTNKNEIKEISTSLSNFIEKTGKIRDFWIIDSFSKTRNNEPSPEQINYFIDNYGINKTNQTTYDIPRIPNSYSIKMVRYLVMKSNLVYSWFLYDTSFSLVPLYYEQICQTNDELYSLQNDININPENPENFPIEFYDKSKMLLQLYCQNALLTTLISQINSNNKNLYDAIEVIATNEIALLSILQFISQKITSIYSNDVFNTLTSSSLIFRNLLKIFFQLSEKNGFNENFFDLCGNKFIDIIISPKWRNNVELLIETCEFFGKLKEDIKLPIRVTQLMSLLIITNDEKAISAALKVYSKFNENELINVNNLLLNYFDHECENEIISPILIDVIKNLHSLVLLRSTNLIQLLNKLINQYSDDKTLIDFISDMFNLLAPNRENSINRSHIIEESSIPEHIRETSPIFWNLFEKNSSIIYDLLNEDPLNLDKFKFLLNYPELLSFNIRSSYFRKKISKKIDRNSTLRLKIDRNNLLISSFRNLQNKKDTELLKRIEVVFSNERGIDAGGLKREWFTDLSKEIFNQNYGLFDCSGSNKCYRPNSLSYINPNHLDYFKFAGKFIARALIESQCIEAHLSSSFCKQILHRQPNLNDLEEFDEEMYSSLSYMLNNDVSCLDLIFAITKDELGVMKTIPLKENGENIDVTNENKMEYIRLRSNYSFYNIIEDQIKAFCEGFDSLISHDEIKIFTADELKLLICGIPVIDVDDFRRNTVFESPYNENTPVVKMFFNVISKWDSEKLAKLLVFMTGSSCVPSNGFKEFCEITGRSLTISPGGEKTHLPQSHTCYNMICLPEYQSEEELNDKLLFAIQNSNSFEFG